MLLLLFLVCGIRLEGNRRHIRIWPEAEKRRTGVERFENVNTICNSTYDSLKKETVNDY